MKLKNLAFFGAMASILSVAAAQAELVNPGYIASKGYVDTKFDSVSGDLGENYYTKTQMDTELAKKQNEITSTNKLSGGLISDGTVGTTQLSDGVNTSLGLADSALQASDVDQTYSASSTKAQSGTAVAQAISGVSSDMTSHINNTDVHVTTADKATWNAKQAALTETQLAAVDSGINSTKVAAYDAYATNKQDTIDATHKLSGTLISDGTVGTTQLSTAVNDAITAANNAAAAVTNTATNTMSVVTYNAQGVITGGTTASELATASLTACPANMKCVVTKDSTGAFAYTPIIEQ